MTLLNNDAIFLKFSQNLHIKKVPFFFQKKKGEFNKMADRNKILMIYRFYP